jgi:hypothetical protein
MCVRELEYCLSHAKAALASDRAKEEGPRSAKSHVEGQVDTAVQILFVQCSEKFVQLEKQDNPFNRSSILLTVPLRFFH